MRETIDKPISPTLVSGPQRTSVSSTGERKNVFIKTRHPKIPNTNPQINGRNPGPGLDSVPGSMRTDSTQIPDANTTQIRELMRSYFFIPVSVPFMPGGATAGTVKYGERKNYKIICLIKTASYTFKNPLLARS
jgi:hypothetical protein